MGVEVEVRAGGGDTETTGPEEEATKETVGVREEALVRTASEENAM